MELKKDILITVDFEFGSVAEICGVDLENGYHVTFTFAADIDIAHDRRFYDDEPQSTTKIINPTVGILQVWNENDDLVSLENSQEKELIKNILNSIQYT